MRPRSWKRLGWTTVGVAYGFAAILAVLAIAEATPPPVREDAQDVAPPTEQLSEVAVDPFYSAPTPAPSEPAWKDSTDHYRGLLHACGARMTQCGETCSIRWRQLMGVGR